MPKFAVLSHVLIPSSSGQATALYRILSGVDPKDYYVINSPEALHEEFDGTHRQLQLGAAVYALPVEPPSGLQHWPPRRDLKTIYRLARQIYSRMKSILRVLRQEPDSTAVIACTANLINIPAAFLASRIARKSFYAYIFDDFVFQWTGVHRQLAKLVAPIIFGFSRGIIGPNEFICEEYERRYHVRSVLVRNPIELRELNTGSARPWPSENGRIRIVYTGAVYHANLDCFVNLVNAMRNLPEFHLELHVFTAQTNALEAHGIESAHVLVHSYLDHEEILEEQRNADILFLPLAFKSPIPEVIRTSAPGKMGQYLASGRPILAHVPADSFVQYYLHAHRCGFVADADDPDLLAAEIKRLVGDPGMRAEFIRNAQEQVRLDFSQTMARDNLLAFLGQDSGVKVLP